MQPQQEMPQPTPVTSPPTQQFVTSKKLLLLGGIVFVFTLTGVGVYAYTQQVRPIELGKTQTILPTEEKQLPSPEIKQTLSPFPTLTGGTQVAVGSGDILVIQNGKETKITDWGYNEKPMLSPDNTKIAYLSKSKESLVNEKTDTGYKRISTNVWIIDIDGKNPMQVTQHKDVVHRNNLHWLDNNRLLFTDGIQSVKVYNLTTKQTATLLGPTTPVQSCLDACGGGFEYIFTSDGSYLIRLESYVGHFAVSYITLSTLQAKELPTQQNDGYYHKTSSYNADNKIFSVTITNPEKNEKHYIANLEAGTISPQ